MRQRTKESGETEMTVKTCIGKITASKEVLSALACVFIDAELYNREKGFVFTAEEQKKAKNQIYDTLYNTGYYDCVKVGVE